MSQIVVDTDDLMAIYAERGRTIPDGTLVHLKDSSMKTQKAVANRFINELADALKMLELENQN